MNQDRDGISLIGRILASVIFILSGVFKFVGFNAMLPVMTAHQIPYPRFFLAASAVIEVLGGLGILFGLFGRFWASLLFFYLVPVTLIFHDFWNYAGPQGQVQMVNFLKNLAIMGGLLQITAFGPGRFSLDRRRVFYGGERGEQRHLRAA
jgi:putative oxidoreductase